jgi:hypothetical protein
MYMDVDPKVTKSRVANGRGFQFTYTIGFKLQFDEASEASFLALEQLATDPSVLERILRAAMLATLVAEYKRRFGLAEDRMTELEKVTGDEAEPEQLPATSFSLRKNIVPAKPGQQSRGAREVTFSEAGIGQDEGLSDEKLLLSSVPSFTSRLQQVAQALFENPVKSTGTGKGVLLGFGHTPTLQRIKTPTHAGYPTTSPYNIMWRQLEYGTGYYAVQAGGPYARTSGEWKIGSPSGSWWYGRRGLRGGMTGVHLLGTRPGSFLRDASGIPYGPDGFKFSTDVYFRLAEFLHGRVT